MRATGPGRAATLPLIGGRLCIDFANTRGWRESERPEEHLASYDDVVIWSVRAGIANSRDATRLRKEARVHPGAARSVFTRVIALREAMYRVFSAIASAHRAPDTDLKVINDELRRASRHRHIGAAADGFAWEWDRSTSSLESPLWPIARSCADVLTSDDVAKLRECAGYPCGWLFIDATKNHSRRWCDTRDCGNRIRVQRHYARTRRTRTA